MGGTLAQKTESATEEQKNFVFCRGDRVAACDFAGQILERRVWEEADALVYLCSERSFQRLSRGERGVWPIGFPKKDVRPLALPTA